MSGQRPGRRSKKQKIENDDDDCTEQTIKLSNHSSSASSHNSSTSISSSSDKAQPEVICIDDEEEEDAIFMKTIQQSTQSVQDNSRSSSQSSLPTNQPASIKLPKGTITAENQLVLPSGEKRKFYCKKHDDLELKLKDCITSKCPFKKHRGQNIEQDLGYLKENCHIKGDECFCKKLNDDNYFDVLGTCNECKHDYHICPVLDCYDAINLSTILKENSKSSATQFNDHLRTHNKLPPRSKIKNEPIANFNNENSQLEASKKRERGDSNNVKEEDDDSCTILSMRRNKEGVINPKPETSSTRQGNLGPGKAYLLARGEEVIPALRVIIESELTATATCSTLGRILSIQHDILEGSSPKEQILANIMRLQQYMKKNVKEVQILEEITNLVEKFDELNDKMGALRCLENLRLKADEADIIFAANVATAAVVTDDSNVPPSSSLSQDQSQIVGGTKSYGMSPNVQEGSLIFFLFFDIKLLYERLKESGDQFIPSKIPVRFIDENGKDYIQELDLLDIQIIVPLDHIAEKKLLSEGLISNEQSKWDEDLEVRWYGVIEGSQTWKVEGDQLINVDNRESKIFNCKQCKSKQLQLINCPSRNCPLKKHLDQDNDRDKEFLEKYCHNVVNGCFCKQMKKANDFDLIGRCDECKKDYHICPIPDCHSLIASSKLGQTGKQEGFYGFNEHLETIHNRIKPKKKQMSIEQSDIIHLSQNSIESLENQKVSESTAVEQISKAQTTPIVPSLLVASSDEAVDAIDAVVNESNRVQFTGDSKFDSYKSQLLEVQQLFITKGIDLDRAIGKVIKLKRLIRKDLNNAEINDSFEKLEDMILDEVDVAATVKSIESIIGKINNLDQPMAVVQLMLDNSSSTLKISPSQDRLTVTTKASWIRMQFEKKPLMVRLFYKINQLHALLKKSGEEFLPTKLPVQFIDLDGQNLDIELEVVGWNLVIPLDKSVEERLIDADLITLKKNIGDEIIARLYSFYNEETDENEEEEENEEESTRESKKEKQMKESSSRSKEKEFYERFADEFDDDYVNKLKKKKFYKRRVDWYILHKCATELSYKPKTGSSKQSNKFQRVIEKYLDKILNSDSSDDQEYKQKALFRGGDLKKSYDNSGLASFMFDYEDIPKLQKSESADSSFSNDENINAPPPSGTTKIEKVLEEMQRAPLSKGAGAKEIFKLMKKIQTIINESKLENFPLPDTRNILLFGRNGNGKSTLINMILFSTTISVDNTTYQKNNNFFNFREFEAIRYLSSLKSPNQIENLKQELGEKWSDIVEKMSDQSYDTTIGSSKSKPSSYELVDFTDLVTKEGKWKENEEYKNELQSLDNLCSGEEMTMLGVIEPFILKNPGRGNQGSCTAHLTRVRYGNRWQAVVELFSLKEIFERFNETDEGMKSNLWEKLINLTNHINEDASSQSKKMKIDIPASSKEAETDLPKSVVEHLKNKQGLVILSTGNDINIDRMIVRSKMFEIVGKYGPLIKDVTVFAPSPLLNQYPLSLVDAPGDDDADWAKGKQLERACKIADAVVIVSKREVGAGLNLNSFAKYFGPSIFKGNHPIPMFVILREDIENKSTVDDLKQLAGKRKEKERTNTMQKIQTAFATFARTFAETNEEKKEFERKAKSLEINGGYFFYTWCAMRAFGNTIKDDKEREILLEESGYNDLQRFMPIVTKDMKNEDTSLRWRESVLEIIRNVKNEVKSGDIKKTQDFILKQLQSDPDDKMYYAFKDELSKHSFFWDSTTGQGKDKSGGKKLAFVTDIEERCNKIARSISFIIKDKLNADLKGEFISRVEAYWTTDNLKQMLSPNIPDVIVESEARIFPEFISPLLNSDDFTQFVDIFQKDVLQEYMECANQAILHHILKKYVESEPWREGRAKGGRNELLSFERLFEEGLKYDENVANAHKYITTIQKLGSYDEEFKEKIDLVLKKYKREFLKGREIFSNVKMGMKTHLFNHLKKKITGDINASEVLNETIKTFNEKDLSDVFCIAITSTYKDVLKVLFNSFVVRTRLPIIRTLYIDFLRDPTPSIPKDKLKFFEDNLNKIEDICSGKQ